jgi:hypothetical protein
VAKSVIRVNAESDTAIDQYLAEPFETDRVHVRDGLKVLPCPFETRGVTCVECRLCLDAPIDPKIVIGFVAHGKDKAKAKRRLEVLNA